MSLFQFIGMDEAGYGPNLGPLLIAATKWTLPDDPAEFDFYEALCGIVFRDKVATDTGIQVADSKQVYSSSGGLRGLETSALSLLHLAGCGADSFGELLQILDPTHAQPVLQLPWYVNSNVSLPVVADPEVIARHVDLLQGRCQELGLSLDQIEVACVEPVHFNAMLETLPNKAEVLTRTAFTLLRRLWNPGTTSQVLVIGDKHGGRNRYDQLLSEFLDGELIFRLEEQRLISRYKVGPTELRFQQEGERHLPVAAASIVAKYFRELAMMQFNEYWQLHLPNLKPTKGYPEDAQRFRQEILELAKTLKQAESTWWRSR